MPEPADHRPDDAEALEGEVVAEVRHLPVPVGRSRSEELDEPRPVSVPATVVAATGGFVLGVAAFVLMRVLRRPADRPRAGRSAAAALAGQARAGWTCRPRARSSSTSTCCKR